MQPFELNKALSGTPVVTREGHKVIEIGLVKSNIKTPVYAVVDYGDRHNILAYDKDGYYLGNSGYNCIADLMLDIKEKWINLYWNAPYNKSENSIEYSSMEEAKKNILENGCSKYQYLTTVKIEN